jgi:hypothetical protein
MKNVLRFKQCLTSIVAISSVVVASQTFAGVKYGYPAIVSANSIAGSMGATRASGTTTDYIEISDQGTAIYVRALQGSTGVSASCVTSDATKMAQLRAAKADAFINVGISAGQCTYLIVGNNSAIAVKVQ